MRTMWLAFIIAVSVGVCSGQELPRPVMNHASHIGGTVSISPDAGVSGEFGTWTVRYTAGPEGISLGGGIRVQLPDEWHAGPRNSANLLQTEEPGADHFVSAEASRLDVGVRAIVENQLKGSRRNSLVKHEKPGLDGRLERYVYVVRVVVESGALRAGDWIEVVFGDRNGGSRGYLASAVSTGPMPVLLAVDVAGDNKFELHVSKPLITARSGKPVDLRLHAPSQAVVGESVRLRLALMDKQFNPASGPVEVELQYPEGVSGPASIRFHEDDTYVDMDLVPNSIGIARIRARWSGGAVLSNPIEVVTKLPERKLYWGDLHSHTKYSWDGVGDNAFDFARYTSGIDFYAMTDHSKSVKNGMNRGLNETYWDAYHAAVTAHNVPGEFVTIHAYECSFRAPYGHHNVYFRGKPGVLRYPELTTLPDLWKALDAGTALTIPHHTGKFPGGVDLRIHDTRFRRNFEMYSGHGLSESFDPKHPLAFEKSLFTSDARSLNEPSHVQDAWRMGLEVSAIAASDDHRSHPGLPHYGLAAVRAESLTRDGVFDALYDRHTYATTGAKIIVYFSVNGVAMGQRGSAQENNRVSIRIHGTDTLERVELLRLYADAEEFDVIQRWTPNGMDFETSWTDVANARDVIYYVRARQQNAIHGRIVMAWSSPVWLTN